MPKFTFPDGRWVELHPMYVLDEIAFDDLASKGEELEAARLRIVEVQPRLDGATTDEQKVAATGEAIAAVAAYERAYQDQLRAFYGRLRDACIATSWGGELGERVTRDELAQLTRRWKAASEDETLPPV